LLRPSAGNSVAPPDNAPVQPPPPSSTVAPPPTAVPPPSSTIRDTGRRVPTGGRDGGLRPVNPTPESLRVAPPPPSAVPSTLPPTINDLNALDVADSSSRGADRTKAVQYYNRVDADFVVRARAAFMVAIAYHLDQQFALAETWVDRAILTNQLTASGPERNERETRYRNWRITNRRMMTSDTTGP
jgi:hypothetical protein